MPKRKRGYDDDDDEERRTNTREPGLGRQYANLRATIPRCTKTLYVALKLARGFERQKLGRRQKQASDEPKTLLRLREEVIVLKQLELERTANIYLLKRLSKAKRVRESSVFEDLYGSETGLEGPKPGAEANVVGRLVNSAPVKEAMTGIMEQIYSILNLKDPEVSEAGIVPTRIKARHDAEDTILCDDSAFEGFSPAVSASGDEEGLSSVSDMDLTVMEAHQHRLDDSDDDDTQSPSSDSPSIPRSPSPSSVSNAKRPAATSFFPNLSMAAYYSGSDSGEDDKVEAKPRKNRRGQRARQQIAEQKYGKTARHLQNQSGNGSRNAGWDTRRGAVDRFDGRKGGPTRPHGTGHSDSRQSKPTQNSRDDAGPLHPSWEAAKLRKSRPADQTKFSGKKITFD